MGKSKEKKASREAKVDKKLALGLGVKRKQLKKKKDRVLDGAVESEGAAGHGIVKENELVGSKKTVLMRQKKSTKHAKVTKRRTKAENLVSVNEDEATPKLKKKSKRQLKESNSPVKVQSASDSNDTGTLMLKKKKRKVKEEKSSVEPNDADDILQENLGTPKLKKKGKRQLKESNSPVKVQSPSDSNDTGTLKLKKKKKKVKEEKSSVEPNDADDILQENLGTPKLKKKGKRQLKESNSPVKVQSPSDSNDTGTLKLKKKKKKVKEEKSSVEPNDADDILQENQDEETLSADINELAAESEVMDIGEPEKAKRQKKNKKKKVKQSGVVNTTHMQVSVREDNLERHVEFDTADVDEIASVDEDCSRGMKKWILEYKQKRPGLKVLQQKIDEFITAHEERQEQEKKEREAAAAEDGWTVVMHHKGRKKTTDAETGTAVGSVSLVAMQEKMAQKKPKEVGLNFYRHQKREAHMTELAMLQSKFEQDKKRIQQLRAQRKFKPY